MSPSSTTGAIGGSAQFNIYETDVDCGGTTYGPYNRNSISTWATTDGSVATVSGGSCTLVAAGTATITANFLATVYNAGFGCQATTVNPGGGGGVTVQGTISLGTVSFTSPNPPVIRLGEIAHLTVNVTSTGVPAGTSVTLTISQTNVSGAIMITVDPVTKQVALEGSETVGVDVTFSPPSGQTVTLPITLNGHALLSNAPANVTLAAGAGREKDSSNLLTIQ
jgi:hypothetical protein